jgi:hypothetical protein
MSAGTSSQPSSAMRSAELPTSSAMLTLTCLSYFPSSDGTSRQSAAMPSGLPSSPAFISTNASRSSCVRNGA